jgi:hydrogenase expression/formation protein HypC
MCLAVPGRIIDVYVVDRLRMGMVDFDGARSEVCLSMLPNAEVGDHVIVHVGFAIARLDEAEAHATLQLLRDMDSLDENRETNG